MTPGKDVIRKAQLVKEAVQRVMNRVSLRKKRLNRCACRWKRCDMETMRLEKERLLFTFSPSHKTASFSSDNNRQARRAKEDQLANKVDQLQNEVMRLQMEK
jgi:hypothetical protein